jgi:hypothetical protein
MKRAIRIKGTGVELELSKVVSVNIDKPMINLEQLPDGTWRLIYTKSLIEDFTQVEAFEVVRED